MPNDQHRFWIVVFLTALMAVLIFHISRVPPIENKKLFKFPLVIRDWAGVEIPMSDFVYQGIETPYLFMRNYSRPGEPIKVNLAVVWFDDKNIAFHTPEKCLGGVGENVLEKTAVKVMLDKEYRVARDIVVMNSTKYLVLYFFDADGFITTSQMAVRFRVLQKRLLFHRASASFVRLMAPILVTEEETMQQLSVFLKTILPLIPQYTYTEMIREPHIK